MKLVEIREAILKGYIAKKLIENNVYPTLEYVCDLLIREFNNYNIASSMVDESYYVKNGDFADAAKFNKLQELTLIDIQTLYDFAQYTYDFLHKSYSSVTEKSAAFERMVRILDAELASLNVLNSDIDNGIVSISDNFNSFTNIDTANTSATVDPDAGIAYSAEAEVSELVPFDSNTVNQIIIRPVDRTYISFEPQSGASVDDMIESGSNAIYQTKFAADHSGDAEVNVRTKLKDNVNISALRINFGDNNLYSVKVFAYSKEAWQLLSDYKSYVGSALISFPLVNTSYISIFIKNATFSSDSRYKISSISINDIRYGKNNFIESSVLQTKELPAGFKFKSISLFAEEDIPSGCDIKYQVNFKASSWSGWQDIEPINRGKIDYSKKGHVIPNLTHTKSSVAIDLTKVHQYIYNNNISADFTALSIQNVELFDYHLLRDIGSVNLDGSDENIASCIIYADTDSIEVDFSQIPGWLNNREAKSKIVLPKGFHTFKFSLSNGYQTYIDSLNSLMTANSGSFYFGRTSGTYIEPSVFLNSVEDNDYTKFTFINIDGTYTLILKIIPSVMNAENMIIVYNDLDANDIAALPSSIKLRAELISNKTNTPILKSYQLKLS